MACFVFGVIIVTSIIAQFIIWDDGVRFPNVDAPNVNVGGLCQFVYGGFWVFILTYAWPSLRVPTLRRSALCGLVGGLVYPILLDLNLLVDVDLRWIGPVILLLLISFPIIIAAWILRGAGRRTWSIEHWKTIAHEQSDDADPSDSPRRRRRV